MEAIEAGNPSDELLEEMASALVKDILSKALAQTQQELLVGDQETPISDTAKDIIQNASTKAIITPVEDQQVSSSVNTTVIQPVDDVKMEAIETGNPSDELLEEMASALVKDILSKALAQTQQELLVGDQETPISDTTIDIIHNEPAEAIITPFKDQQVSSSVNTTVIQPVDDVKMEAIEAGNPSDEILEDMASVFVKDILSKALAQTQQVLLVGDQETPISDTTKDIIQNASTKAIITPVEDQQVSSSVNTTVIQPVDDIKMEAIEAENPSDELLEEMASAFVKDILSKALAQTQQELLVGDQETPISDTTKDIIQNASTKAIITPVEDQKVSSSVNTTVIQPVDDVKMEAIETGNPSDELLEEMASALVKDILSKALAQAQQELLVGDQETPISDTTKDIIQNASTKAIIPPLEDQQVSSSVNTTVIQPVDDIKMEAIEAENPSDELLEEMASAFVKDILSKALAQTQQELLVGDLETPISDATIDIIHNEATEAIITPFEATKVSSSVNTTVIQLDDIKMEAIEAGNPSDELLEEMASAFVKDILSKALAQTQQELLVGDQETPISDTTKEYTIHNEATEAIITPVEAPQDSSSANTTVIQPVDDIKMEAIENEIASDERLEEMASALVKDILFKALAQTQQELLVGNQETPISDTSIVCDFDKPSASKDFAVKVSDDQNREDGQETVAVDVAYVTENDQSEPKVKLGSDQNQEKISKEIICEGEEETLNCTGCRFIHVVSATYGRHEDVNVYCYHKSTTNTNCGEWDNVLEVTSQHLNNTYNCSMHSSHRNLLVDDPCPFNYKYLEIDFECIQGVDPCQMLNCQNGGTCVLRPLCNSCNASCMCRSCFTGDSCENRIDICSNVTCPNGGMCVPNLDTCETSCTGYSCEKVGIAKTVSTDGIQWVNNSLQLVDNTKVEFDLHVQMKGDVLLVAVFTNHTIETNTAVNDPVVTGGVNSTDEYRYLTELFICNVYDIVTNSSLEAKLNFSIFKKMETYIETEAVVKEPICLFFNETQQTWSDEGVITTDHSQDKVSCSSDHITSFSVLMKVTKAEDSKTLSLMSRVCGSLSLIALVVSLIVYCLFPELWKALRVSIHKNLVVNMILMQSLFIFGIDKTVHKHLSIRRTSMQVLAGLPLPRAPCPEELIMFNLISAAAAITMSSSFAI
ncbi:versican core protein-like [Anneissia japonica]|uniref:versican core protein-like n=1 Tax=Anneissia japonica TaxID=1529436 RepID=UPI0014259C0F|nr:versican core protein-like [Anneissia japonica]